MAYFNRGNKRNPGETPDTNHKPSQQFWKKWLKHIQECPLLASRFGCGSWGTIKIIKKHSIMYMFCTMIKPPVRVCPTIGSLHKQNHGVSMFLSMFLSKKPSCSIPYTPCLDYATRFIGQNFRIRHQRHPRLISSWSHFSPYHMPMMPEKKKIWMMILAHPRSPKNVPAFWKATCPLRGAGGLPWQSSSVQRKESKFNVQTSLKAFLEEPAIGLTSSDCMMIVFVRPTIAVILQWCMMMYDDVWWCMMMYDDVCGDIPW